MSGPFAYHRPIASSRSAKSYRIPHERDVFKYYRSDSSAEPEADNHVRTAIVAFCVDVPHGDERIHREPLESIAKLLS